MLKVRVPGGTRSGRWSRVGVLGKAYPAPFTSPPPGAPSFPARAGSAKTARMPLPPFWLRSRPLPTLIAVGELADLCFRHLADPRGLGHGHGPRSRHVLLEPEDVLLDEGAVERAAAL